MSQLTTARWHLLNDKMPWPGKVNDAVLELLNDKLGYAPPTAIKEPIAKLPEHGQRQKVALCLGHARPVDQGNIGAGGISEEQYNTMLIGMIATKLTLRGIECIVVDYYPGQSYEEAMQWLAMHLVRQKCTAAVEFHFNAYDGRVHGREVLHWEHSKRGILLAECLLAHQNKAFPDRVNRGLKPRNYQDRGALFLSLTHCPAAISEPFFGDTPEEWEYFSKPENIDRLAEANTDGIAHWVETQEAKA